jgi:hypothetical protein
MHQATTACAVRNTDGADGDACLRAVLRRRAGRRALLVVAGALLGAIVLNVGVALADTASFTSQGCSMSSVPAGVLSVQIAAVGAAGSEGTDSSGTPVTAGGDGDGVSATLSVTPGQILDVCVDSGGGAGGSRSNDLVAGGMGGGASGVAVGDDFSAPVVVAGGGGGGGSALGGGPGGTGGPAGQTGGNSHSGAGNGGNGTIVFGGQGGSETPAGQGGQPDNGFGEAGANGSASDSGGPGIGGAGDSDTCDGGGGGAGYFGGGGGAGSTQCGGGGGGGGSDFCAPSVSPCAITTGEGVGTSAGSAAGDAQVVLSFTPAAAPLASITGPASGATYTQGQVVDSSFACAEGTGGTGIVSCLDQSGHASGSAIDTSTAGSHTLTVTATSSDGLTGTASVPYTVVAPPPAPPPATPTTAPPTRPRVSAASLGSKSFAAAKGTTITLNLSEAGSITVVVAQRVTGHKVAGVCSTHAKKGKRCTLTRDVKTLHLRGVVGANRLRLLIKRLRPGSYTARITASDSVGSSKPVTLRFKIK